MKQFLRIFTLLIVSLFLAVSGIDAALDHLSRSVTQSSLTGYNEQGNAILAYNGDLNAGKAAYAKPGPASLLHRS